MIDPKIHVAIKSYRRAGRVKTLDVFPFATVWVPESQGDEYEECYPGKIQTIPDERDGNLCRKSNAILDLSPCPWTLILDDDIPAFGYWEAGGHVWMEPTHVAHFINNSFRMASELGVKLWGVNQGKDELWHYTYRPFSLLAPVLGPFNGHLEPWLRYDESVLGKDDYDFWLQNIQEHRKTLRFNKYHYLHDHGKMAGGFVSMRTKAAEEKGIERMIQKWGSTLYSPGGSAGGKHATGRNILNSKVRIPIPGC
jgi:hypothetical protein